MDDSRGYRRGGNHSCRNRPLTARGQINVPTRPHRVFVSFDFYNDHRLSQYIIGQARLPDSPFEVADWSLKEAAPQRSWEARARERIKRSDSVLVMLGPYTHRTPGVLKEVRMAREMGKAVFQIIGYRNSHPRHVRNAGRVYRWNWNNLKKLLAPLWFVDSRPRDNIFRTRDPFRRSRRFL